MSDGFRTVEPAVLAKMVGNAIPAAEFLSLFGVRVRNHDNVARISACLAEAEVSTIPSFTTCAGTSALHFVKAKPTAVATEDEEDEHEDELSTSAMPHRALQIGDLPSARNGVESVSSDTDLAAATMLMRVRNYSQLPVINGTADLRGVLTWSSIAVNLETGKQPTLTSALAPDPVSAEVNHQLLAHLPTITKHGYVLVRASNGKFCGIVTAADVSDHFETMARPFFLVGDIEARLRKCLAVLDEEAVKAVQKRKKTGKIVDLTFGEYKYLIDNEANWKRIGWTGVPRDQLVHRLDRVRMIRNEIAHFRPQPLSTASLATLEEFAGLLKQYVP